MKESNGVKSSKNSFTGTDIFIQNDVVLESLSMTIYLASPELYLATILGKKDNSEKKNQH